MALGDFFRASGRSISGLFHWLGDRFSYNERGTGWRLTRRVLMGAAVLLPGYLIIGMILTHKIDDDIAYGLPNTMPDGASRTVAMASGLIKREIQDNGWTPDDTFLAPGYYCDNMQNFQIGMINAIGRFATELRDLLGRARGSGQADPDLEQAIRLNYPPDVWFWNPTESLLPQETSESVYMNAAKALDRYNTRVAAGSATFETRADNLASALDRMANDIGSSSARLTTRMTAGWSPLDWTSDNIFYQSKGQVYVYFMLLKELREDFQSVLAEKEVGKLYTEMLASFEAAVRVGPWMISNGGPSNSFIPNHLGNLGFYLLRARTQLLEIVDVLRA